MDLFVKLAGFLLGLSVLLNGLAVWRAWRFVAGQRTGSRKTISFRPPVSVLVPVCGIEGGGIEHFLRYRRIDWPGYQVIFTVLEDSDPALPVLRQISSTAGVEVSLQVGGAAGGANRKIRNLLNAMPLVRHEWIVICDADVEPSPSFLEDLMAPFGESAAERHAGSDGNGSREAPGLVHCLYRHLEERSVASSWENVWINCDFWPQALLGDWLLGTDFAFGAAMAMRRTTLQEIGGLEAVRNHLADDYHIGHQVARLGKRIVFSDRFITLHAGAQSWSETWRHLLRWSRTIRVCQPAGFAGSILTNITLFALIAVAVKATVLLPWAAAALILRVALANQCRNWITGRRGLWSRGWLILFKDLAQVMLWGLAFHNGAVEWRGARYRLKATGELEPLQKI